jgi:hypothetical protein
MSWYSDAGALLDWAGGELNRDLDFTGDVTDFSDRWDWMRDELLPTFRAFEEGARRADTLSDSPAGTTLIDAVRRELGLGK